jgi:DNA-binding transcriptional LysR family regulator
MLDVTRLRVLDALARLGSVTAAAKELHYTQPTVSHHLARLEAETGAQLLQRVGRGVRLTPAGQLLAERAAEIIGRLDAADGELAAHIELTAGRVRLASFSSVIGSLVPRAVAALTEKHPGLQIDLTSTQPPEALELLRAGKIDVALIFRYDETEPEPENVRLHHLLDDPLYLLSTPDGHTLETMRDATWIAGCERCRSHLLSVCADLGFHGGHGRDAGAGRGRARRDDQPRAGPARPPPQRPRGHRIAWVAPAHLRGDLRRPA